jgi:hypothetical protein
MFGKSIPLPIPPKPAPADDGDVLFPIKELRALLADKAKADHKEATTAENKQREAFIAERVTDAIRPLLEKEAAKSLPDEKARTAYADSMRAFVSWAGRHGLPHLPADGHVVAAYLLTAEVNAPEAAKAIRLYHDCAEQYLDDVPICAALALVAERGVIEPAPEETKLQ